MRHAIFLLILCGFSLQVSCRENPVERFKRYTEIKHLGKLAGLLAQLRVGNEADFDDVRAKVIEIFNNHPEDVWLLGKELFSHYKSYKNHVEATIEKIITDVAEVQSFWYSHQAISLGATIRERLDNNQRVAIFVILVTSQEMFSFYRKHAQEGHPVKETNYVPFEKKYLVMVSAANSSLIDLSWCRRNFLKSRTEVFARAVEVLIVKDQMDFGSRDVTYLVHRADLPLDIEASFNGDPPTRFCTLENMQVTWGDLLKVVESKNLLALRHLAETCDDKVPAENRRRLLEVGYRLDPLLPYVLFRHLSKNHPTLLKEDQEYWKDKMPTSKVIGKLFQKALEISNE
jgi:hypothetical protein